MHPKEKIRQHYVSQLYLDNWKTDKSNEDPSIWSLNKITGKIFKVTNLSNISQKNRFYKVVIDDIVWDMLQYLFASLQHEPLVAQTMHALNPLLLVNRYRENKLDHYEKLAVIETNFLEDRYADLENWFAHTIKKISEAGEKLSDIFEENEAKHYDSLMLFFATQHFRTLRARQKTYDITKDMYLRRGDGEEHKLSPQQVDTVTKIRIYVDSVRFAESLSRSDFNVSLDFNVSNIDLVTSSSPTLGYVAPRERHDDITSFTGCVPLSPKINMRLHQSSGRGKRIEFGTLGKQKVLSLNRLQVKNSNMDIYATSERQLKFFLKLLTS